MRLPLALFALAAVLPLRTAAAEFAARTPSELRAAVARVRPGDVVVMESGEWTDLDLRLTVGGDASAPVTLRAREPGRVVLRGASSLRLEAPYIVVTGLLFRGGALAHDAVVSFLSDHGRCTDSAIVDYNPASAATSYYWVWFEGNHNRMDHCLLRGKNHQQPVVGNAIANSRYNTVDHCVFRDIPYVPNRNGREIFRIWGYGGNEQLGDDGAFFTIEHNLFDHADGEGEEIISLKSNRNRVRFNTLRQSRGGITNRSGNFNLIEGNLILADGYPGAYGLRLTGQHHRVVNNYIEGAEYGIHLMAGEYIDRDLTGSYQPIPRAGTPLGRVPAYQQPKHNLIAFNTLVDTRDSDLLLGKGYRSGWPKAQRILLPEQNLIAGNLIVKTQGGLVADAVVPDRSGPTAAFTFEPNQFVDNLVLGGNVAFAPPIPTAGFRRGEFRLQRAAGGLLVPEHDSPLLVSVAQPFEVARTLDDQPRRGPTVAGAFATSGRAPLDRPAERRPAVGPAWPLAR